MREPATSVVALVPMRGGSQRVVGKNYRTFGDRPLFHHVLDVLAACPEVARIVVDTDCERVSSGIRECFAHVALLERPERLRGGEVPMNEVLAYDVEQFPAELYLQTHATNPLLLPATIRAAIGRLLADRDRHDSLFSVTRHQKRLWTVDGEPLNHDPARLQRTQDLVPFYEENSCIYLFTGEQMRATGNRIGARPLMFEIDPIEAWDIDDEQDFRTGELLYRARAAGEVAGGESR